MDWIFIITSTLSVQLSRLNICNEGHVQSIEEIGKDDDDVEVNELVLQLQATLLGRAYKKFKELGVSSEEKPTEPKRK